MDLVVATHNSHKIMEIKAGLAGSSVVVHSLQDYDPICLPIESGETFSANAWLKARAIRNLVSDSWILADDSGLVVDALGGAPGVLSARYAGEEAGDQKNNEKLLMKLHTLPDEERAARFLCVMALISPFGKEFEVEGALEGRIAKEGRGREGFGYDPLFWLPNQALTLAELTLAEKNRISHRGQALRKIAAILSSFS